MKVQRDCGRASPKRYGSAGWCEAVRAGYRPSETTLLPIAFAFRAPPGLSAATGSEPPELVTFARHWRAKVRGWERTMFAGPVWISSPARKSNAALGVSLGAAMSHIDPAAREQAAILLERFLSGEFSYDDVEVNWPSSADRGVGEISEMIWMILYREVVPVRIRSVDPDNKATLERCMRFLRSGLVYSWPDLPPSRILLSSLERFFTLGASRTIERENMASWERFKCAGDFAVWPYSSTKDMADGS